MRRKRTLAHALIAAGLFTSACSGSNDSNAPQEIGSGGSNASPGSGGSAQPGSGGTEMGETAGTPANNGGSADNPMDQDAASSMPMPGMDAASVGVEGGLGPPSGKSAGCMGPASTDPIQKAVEHDMMVKVADKYAAGYTSRKYYTTLPKSYDPTNAYPVIFYGQGCGQTGPENGPFSNDPYASEALYVQLIPAAVTGQTVVPSDSAPGCFEAGSHGLADSPDGPYFDQALAEIESKYCIDRGKVFVAGWSSGAWITTYLACTRGNVIRGGSTVAGGLQHDHGTCIGGASVIMIIGTGDGENPVVNMVGGFDVGTGQARDVLVKANGCTAAPTTWDPMYPTCQIYGGCAAPIVWCPVGGGHGAGMNIQAASAWKLWTSLK
jgi:poly(3-hydroxybutyrate) depolymerase